jgi:thiamine biosynthesis lipoprotein ApbE
MADLKQTMQAASAKMARAEKAAIAAVEKSKEKPDDAKLKSKAEELIKQHQAAVDAYDAAKAAFDEAEANNSAASQDAKANDSSNQEPIEPSGVFITITAKRKKGFWRCGVFHPGEAVEHPLESFTEEEWQRLRDEPRLIVEE